MRKTEINLLRGKKNVRWAVRVTWETGALTGQTLGKREKKAVGT